MIKQKIDNFTKSQEEGLSKLEAFLSTKIDINDINTRVFLLMGKAGSGKTTIIRYALEKQLKHDKENINPHDVFFDMFNLPNVFGITQSHKAKMVLMQSLWVCGTFASAFDLKEKIDQATGKRTFERTGKYISDKAVCRYPIKVFVHDECSMYSQQMLDYVLKDTNYSGKIIFMGERLPM